MTDEVVLAHFTAQTATDQREELIALYEEVWLSGWKDDEPFFSRERFVDRLRGHLAATGFELVTARLDGRLIGYMYGFHRVGSDSFAVCELMVAAAYRRKGVARRLHDELLGSRGERTAELLAEKGNLPAQTAYQRWGWRKTADHQPFPDAPNYDLLVLALRKPE
jgi:GNAT superfamily N-acetyltransferase